VSKLEVEKGLCYRKWERSEAAASSSRRAIYLVEHA
jgi:hypothetical protein